MSELSREIVNDSSSIEDIITYRHWHPQSEPYAGGDSLATALYLGWTMGNVVSLEEHWYAGTRRVAVFYFELMRDSESVMMPVIGNPFTDRLIVQSGLQVIPVGSESEVSEKTNGQKRL